MTLPPFDWNYEVEDIHGGDPGTEYRLSIVAFYRRITVAYSTRLRHRARQQEDM